MAELGEEDGTREPRQHGAQTNSADYRKLLRDTGKRLWHWIAFPWHWWRSVDHKRRTANATVLLTIGTLVLAGVNTGMLFEMRHASRDTKNAIQATNRLAQAAENYTIETKRIADTSGQTAERQLRAYIGVVNNGVLLKCPLCGTVDIDKLIEIKPEQEFDNIVILTIQNGGQTPAYNVRFEDSYSPVQFGQRLRQGFDYQITSTNTPSKWDSGGTLNPGQQTSEYMIIDKSNIPLIVRAKRNLITLYYYGNVHYTDVFGIHRTTPFCGEYLPDYPGEDSFGACSEHNTPEQGK